MTRKTLGAISVILLLSTMLWQGCSRNSGITSYVNQPAVLLSVSPANGSVSVPASSRVTLVFSSGMDRLTVQQSFLLLNGQRMHDFMDSLTNMHSQPDSMYMRQTFDQYCWAGKFLWNSQNDTCVFYPDTSLAPRSEYMIFLMHDLDQHHQMNQYNGATLDQDFQSHFTTSDNQ